MWHKACGLDEISADGIKRMEVAEEDVCLVKDSSGAIFAFQNLCSHQDMPLHKGRWNSETGEITCPFHKARFSVKENGKPLCSPAFIAITTYPTEVRENEVYIKIED